MPPKKKNQTVIHEFACEIFPRKLWIVKKPPHGYLEKHFQTAGGEKLHEYDVDDAKAVTYKEIYNIDTDKLGILIVLLENNITVSDCAHEVRTLQWKCTRLSAKKSALSIKKSWRTLLAMPRTASIK